MSYTGNSKSTDIESSYKMPANRSILSFFGERYSPISTPSRSPTPTAAPQLGDDSSSSHPEEIEPEEDLPDLENDVNAINFADDGMMNAAERMPIGVDELMDAEEHDNPPLGLFEATLDNPHVLLAPLIIVNGALGVLFMFLQNLVWETLLTLTLAHQVRQPSPDTHRRPDNKIGLRQWLAEYESLPTLEERTRFVVYGSEKALTFQPEDEEELAGEWTWTWDVDSILYTFFDYTLTMDVKYYPFPNRNSTLRFNNHLSIPETNPAFGKRAFLSQIPNMVLASGGPANNIWINIFFPSMRHKRGNRFVNYMNMKNTQFFYERIFRPAIQEAAPSTWFSYMHGLPNTYTLAQERARSSGGTFRAVGTAIPGELFQRTMANVRHRLDTMPEAANFRGYFFHLYVKGIKNTTGNRNPLSVLQDSTWANLLRDCKHPEDLIVDTGINFSFEANNGEPVTLLWNKTKLAHLLHASGWKAPTVDEWCHTRDVAGLRAVPKEHNMSKGHVVSMQAYHGEKHLTYIDTERNIGLKFSQSDVLLDTNRYRVNIENLRKAFTSQVSQSFHARYEFRLTYPAMLRLKDNQGNNWMAQNLQACLVPVPSSHVARFKIALLSGWHHIATSMAAHLTWTDKRKWQHARLADMCLLMIRGLVSRQDDDSASRRLIRGTHLNESYAQHGRAVANPAFVKIQDFKIIFDPTEEARWAQRKARTHLAFGQTVRRSTVAAGSGRAPALAAPIPLDEVPMDEGALLLPYDDSLIPTLVDERQDVGGYDTAAHGGRMAVRKDNVLDMTPWANWIFDQCKRDLWSCTLKDYVKNPELEAEMQFTREFFLDNLHLEWVGTGKSISKILTWFELFRYLFPDSSTEDVGLDPNNKQRAWTNMKYRERYRNLASALDSSRVLLDALLWKQFLAGDAAPAVSKERPWKTGKAQKVRIMQKKNNRIGVTPAMTAALNKFNL